RGTAGPPRRAVLPHGPAQPAPDPGGDPGHPVRPARADDPEPGRPRPRPHRPPPAPAPGDGHGSRAGPGGGPGDRPYALELDPGEVDRYRLMAAQARAAEGDLWGLGRVGAGAGVARGG